MDLSIDPYRRLSARIVALMAALIMLALLAGCSGGGGTGSDSGASAAPPAAPTQPASIALPAAASVSRVLEVPSALAQGPFVHERRLSVPPGFGVRLWARVAGARFLALAPNGDVLVSVPSEGRIRLLRARSNDVPQEFDYASGLRNPHDMVFHRIGDTTYLYVAESHRITRSEYQGGETRRSAPQVVVDDLPDSSTPALLGSYGHQLKNIALGPDHRLYVSIASACNACLEDTTSDPLRGAIYQYSADGGERRLFARGIRNAEGLDFIPGTNDLWVAVNHRDDIRVPLDIDVDGDRQSDLGAIIDRYVDDHPPDPFTLVRDGAHYGWPFCNPVPNAGMAELELLPDFEVNRDGERFACAGATRPSRGLRAHSSPLGLSFLHNSNVPAAYRRGAVIAQHGCWNCSSLRAGYKVVFMPFDDAGRASAEMDLVTGFVTDPDAREVWGRPVDAIADAGGGLLISDDFAGAIYQLYPAP